MRRSLIILLFLILFQPSKGISQNISCTWTGKMYFNYDTVTISIELEIFGKDSLKGYSSCYTNNFFGKASIKGDYNRKTKSINLTEIELIKTNMPKDYPVLLDRYILNLNKTGNEITGLCECIPDDAVYTKFKAICHEDYKVILDLFLPPENKEVRNDSTSHLNQKIKN